jgi:hypothetical protein
MLVITQQQTAVLQTDLERSFIERLVEWAGRKYVPGVEVSAELAQRVEAAYRRARDYALNSRRNIAEFVDLDMRLGAAFEDQPGNGWMKDILANRDLSGPTRIYRIEGRLERLAAMAASQEEESSG